MKPASSKNKFVKSFILLLLFLFPIILNFFTIAYEITYISHLPITVDYTLLIIILFVIITITFFLQKYISKKNNTKKV